MILESVSSERFFVDRPLSVAGEIFPTEEPSETNCCVRHQEQEIVMLSRKDRVPGILFHTSRRGGRLTFQYCNVGCKDPEQTRRQCINDPSRLRV